MKKIIGITLLFVLVSCNKREYINPYFIEEEDLPVLKQLELEKIEVPEDCIYTFSYVCRDSLFIAINLRPTPYFITIYNMNKWNVVGEYFQKGNGPNELLHLICTYKNGKLLIQDFYKNYFIKFSSSNFATHP